MSHGFLPAIQVNGQTGLPPSPPHKRQNLSTESPTAATAGSPGSITDAAQSRPTARLPGITRKDSDFVGGGKGTEMEVQTDKTKQVRKKSRSPRRRKKMNSWHSWPDVDSPDRMFPDIMCMDSKEENTNHGVILPPLGHGTNWKTFQRTGEDNTTRCKSVDSEVGSASEETDSRMSSPELDLKCTSWLEGLRRAQSDDLLLLKQSTQMK
ncbi:hypothetical protein Bbelb_435720 [Branchiostoma belcheri]|nr:hypothetical protein Bbelb_435720 [Branchiostoma belcheri]